MGACSRFDHEAVTRPTTAAGLGPMRAAITWAGVGVGLGLGLGLGLGVGVGLGSTRAVAPELVELGRVRLHVRVHLVVGY